MTENTQLHKIFHSPWQLLSSADHVDIFPDHDFPEIALAGRSNVGKSSLINSLCQHGKLCRISNTPGRTQKIHFFHHQQAPFIFVDMPGYGYAKASKNKVSGWNQLILDYIRGRVPLSAVLLLIDARHGIKPSDQQVMELCKVAAVYFQPILTKSDKISKTLLAQRLDEIGAETKLNPASSGQVLVSSVKENIGIETIQQMILEKISNKP